MRPAWKVPLRIQPVRRFPEFKDPRGCAGSQLEVFLQGNKGGIHSESFSLMGIGSCAENRKACSELHQE